MAFPKPLEKYKEPISGFAGAGAGLFAGELTSEFATRVTGQTGYSKAGVKTVVKGLLGIVMFMTGGVARGAWGIFWKAFAYANWGSTILDWIFAAYPGGVFGMAERAAVTVRTWAMGTRRVAAQISALPGTPATARPPAAPRVGRYG